MSLGLGGCAFDSGNGTGTKPTAAAGGTSVTGRVRGGQQPVAGATVQLWQIGSAGYGAGSMALGSSVTTAADGTFSLTGQYSCATAVAGNNTLLYITATGGNPGLSAGTNNSAIVLMTGLGSCGNLTPGTFISINELTTVATVYALGQFMSPSGQIGSYAASTTGLSNAFQTLNNLVDTNAGVARSVTPAGNGIVPQSKLNTIADILATCVNTATPTSGPCSALFGAVAATGNGAPSTVLGAALQIAQNPAYNVNALLGLSSPTAPFQPTVSAATDWTIALSIASGGGSPSGIAIDGTGSVWVANYGTGGANSSVSSLSAAGVPAPNSPFSNAGINGAFAVAVDSSANAWVANHDNGSAVQLNTGGSNGSIQVIAGPVSGLSTPTSVAIDRSGDVWFTDLGSNSLTELVGGSVTGTPASFTTLGLNQPVNIAFDAANNAWIANSGGSVTKFTQSPAQATSFINGGLSTPAGVVIDGQSNVWVSDASLGQIAKLSSSGTALSPNSGYTGGGLTGASAEAIDGSGNLWVADASGNALSELSTSGGAVSGSSGYGSGTISAPKAMAIDGSGDIWIANGSPAQVGGLTATLTEFIGIAAPVNTPQASAVQTATLAERPGTPLPVANASGPYAGTAGVAVAFNASQSTAPAGQSLSYLWSFGDGVSAAGVAVNHAYAVGGQYTVTLTVTATDGANASVVSSATIGVPNPAITNFSPTSGPVGTLVTVNGSNLAPPLGSATHILLSQQGGGTIVAPVSSVTTSSLSFVIPAGAATGAFTVTAGTQSTNSSGPLTVTASSSYTVAAAPATSTLVQGQSTSLGVSISSTNGFAGTAALGVSGLPTGVTASFQPAAISAGQTAILTLSAPANQAAGTSALTVTASASIDGIAVSQTSGATLTVQAVTTSFLGRTVVDDTVQEPLAGVTVSFMGVDDKGNSTGCSAQTVSDGGGNFLFTNLPAACVGPQLISYNGLTATSPAGQYAGVNLSYTLTANQVTSSPVLVHLPRIDNAETVQVQQNASTDQIFYFHTIPGVQVTVYAGTTLSLDDGSQPNPFPLVALSIPLDRLPDQIPTTGMLMPFIVAFQPANAVASQPVAVNFPNSLGIAPNTSVTFVTLDPTHGYMVPYGTGTVSNDGSQFVANADPNHPGHAYGLVHFDWHGPATGVSPNGQNPGPDGAGGKGSGVPPAADCGCAGSPNPPPTLTSDPVDLSSGLVTYHATDLEIGGQRGGLSVTRTYRTQTPNSGRYGRGTTDQYSMLLSTIPLLDGESLVYLITPDGNQYAFNKQPNGTFINSSVPAFRGAVLSGSTASTVFTLQWMDGTTYTFQIFPSLGSGQAFLSSITDLNGNKTTLGLNSAQPQQILTVTDPVGRSLTFTYDTSNRVTQVTDPIGRRVAYTYNSNGTLATVTDPNGGVTKYGYDSNINLASITDARGVVTEQNTYNESFDGRITQQVAADGGVTKYTYTLQNPTVANSPVLQTVVTDPLNNQTTYRFNMQGFLVSVTDASGQTRLLTRDPNHFNLVSDYTGNGNCSQCGNSAAGDIHYTFDDVGNVLTVADSLGDTTTFAYDTRFNKVNSVTDPLGDTTGIAYDASGNALTVTDANGHTTATAYDQFGEPVQLTDASGAKTTMAYDAFGDVASVTNAAGSTTYFTYDGGGRLTQVQDALGRKGSTSYDVLNRVTSVTDPLGNKTQLTYDAVGGLLTLQDPKGNTTTFTYDSRERLSTRTSALGKAQSYSYDLDSDLTQFTDRRGQVSKFTFDVMNRPTKATYQDSTVAYSYDAAGRLLAVTDSMDGSFGYKYDAAGRLLQQSEPTGVIQYTHDATGRVATEQVVGQPATTYTYDAVGNLLSTAMPSAGVTYTYDARNLPLTLARTNGVTSTFSYDSIGELLSLVHGKGASVLNSFAYKYDATGSRSQVTSPSAQALTTQSSTSTVDAGNQLLTNTGTTYTYDANGNRLTETTSSSTRTYNWDARNRLTSVTDSTGTTTLAYDYNRNLLGISASSGAAQSFVVDAATNVDSYTPATGGTLSILHGTGLDSHWASVNGGGTAVFGITDALGSTAALTDANGDSSSELSYEPYGQINGTVAANSFPFAYTGRVPVLGNIQYFRNRYYDTGVGRFLSEDPAGISSGSNAYIYAGDDPMGSIDPTGLDTITLHYYTTGTGHSAVQVNDGPAVGYGQGGASVWWLLADQDTPGVMYQATGPEETVTFQITTDQAKAANSLIRQIANSPGNYNLYNNDCSITAGNILRAAGVDLPSTFVPSTLYNEAVQYQEGTPTDQIPSTWLGRVWQWLVPPAY